MKRYLKQFFILVVLFIIGFIVVVAVVGKEETEKVNRLALNDIARDYLAHWDELSDFYADSYGVEFQIFDREGKCVVQSSHAKALSYRDAVSKGYPFSVISEGSKWYGVVVLCEGSHEIYLKLKNRLLLMCGAIIGTLFVVTSFYLLRFQKYVIKPFEQMEYFASQIANGNLDVPLTMNKTQLFGRFTESFDIMREELLAARKREGELKKKEKELVASLSHDLKTPITEIKLASEILALKVSDEDARKKVDNIYKKAEQMDALVSDLFTSTLDDLGEMHVSCKDEISRVLSEMVVRHDDKQLVTQGDIPDCLIHIDLRRMEQIIANIISNSYKYANTKIEIEYAIIEGYLRMDIRDYGPGISQNELPLVTNKFFRGRSEEVSMQEGSGLGLHITKVLIEKMNGEILCQNADPGFRVRLLISLSC